MDGFPGRSDSRECACNAGDPDSIPGLGRSPREGDGYPLHILASEIPWMDPGGLPFNIWDTWGIS